MSIYTPITITEKILANFEPTRLYIKRHSITGLKYLGKSCVDDINKYTGSGKRWLNHLKRHDKRYVTTVWVSDWFTDPYELQDFALLLSEDLDIVNSPGWANLKPEYGIEGHRPIGELNGMYGSSRTGDKNPFYKKHHTAETKAEISRKKKGQIMPNSHREATSSRMLISNPMDNQKSVQKIRDSMAPSCCILCGVERKGEQNLLQHYNSSKCKNLQKKKELSIN